MFLVDHIVLLSHLEPHGLAILGIPLWLRIIARKSIFMENIPLEAQIHHPSFFTKKKVLLMRYSGKGSGVGVTKLSFSQMLR